MVQTTHSGANEEKCNEILLAAQKRFGIYGYYKTTMHEIADDLGISKASLYYYYPDKDTLFRAVFQKEKQEMIDRLQEAIVQSNDAIALIYAYINLRMSNFKMFLNLSRAGIEEIRGVKNVVNDLWELFLKKEKEEILKIFDIGIKNKVFDIQNIDDDANIFIDSLRGILHIYLHNKNISYLNDNEFEQLNIKIKQFTKIFIKGISI